MGLSSQWNFVQKMILTRGNFFAKVSNLLVLLKAGCIDNFSRNSGSFKWFLILSTIRYLFALDPCSNQLNQHLWKISPIFLYKNQQIKLYNMTEKKIHKKLLPTFLTGRTLLLFLLLQTPGKNFLLNIKKFVKFFLKIQLCSSKQ